MLRKKHFDTLTNVDNFTLLFQYQNKYDEIEQMKRQTLNNKKKILRKKYLDTLTNVNNLILMFQFQNKYKKTK